MPKNGRRKSKLKRKIRDIARKIQNRIRGRKPDTSAIESYKRTKSSNIHGIAYAPKQKILTIKFKGRESSKPVSTYQYFNVPKSIHAELLKQNARRVKKGKKFGSVGKLFAQKIRGKYQYEKIED